jgi:hypothetical protein
MKCERRRIRRGKIVRCKSREGVEIYQFNGNNLFLCIDHCNLNKIQIENQMGLKERARRNKPNPE